MTTESVEHTFAVRTPARLTLANIRGSVKITAGEVDTMHILANKHLDSGDADNTQILINQAEDGSVSVETRFNGKSWLSQTGMKPCKVDYLVRVPQESNLNLNGVSNSISIEDVSGTISVSTVSGSVKLFHLAGPLQVKSVSGDISGDKINGELALETVSGDVQLVHSNLSEIRASTVSGDMHIHSPLSNKPVQLKSVSGDAILAISPQTGCTINSRSISGEVVTPLPVTQRNKSLGQTQVKINGGGTSIQHHSISGDLIIKDSENTEMQATEAKQETPDHMEILERIERGEMTVEEALNSLLPESPTN